MPSTQSTYSSTTLVSTSLQTPGLELMSVPEDTRRSPSIMKWGARRCSGLKIIFSSQIVRLLPDTGACSDRPGLQESFDECIQVIRTGRHFSKGLLRPRSTRWWWRRVPGAQSLGWQTEPTFVGIRRTERRLLISISQTDGIRITFVLIPAPSLTCTSDLQLLETLKHTESSFYTSRKASKSHQNFKDTRRCLSLQK